MPDDLEALLRREIERHIEDRGWDHWEAEDRGRYRDALAARQADEVRKWLWDGSLAALFGQMIEQRSAARKSESEAVGLLEELSEALIALDTIWSPAGVVRRNRAHRKVVAYLASRKEASQ